MSMSVRLQDPKTGQEHSFDVGRDIAYFYPQLVEMAIKGCQSAGWEPWYGGMLSLAGATEEELLLTLRDFSIFCELAIDPDLTTPRTALDKSGFFKRPHVCQLVVMAKIGQLCAGAFWAGIRHSTMLGVVPESIKMIKSAAEDLTKYIDARWHSDYADKTDQSEATPAV